jgi:hypothetical protein
MSLPALAVAVAIAASASAPAAEIAEDSAPAARMAAAATKFLDALTPELRAKAALPFEDQARLDWHYVPRDRIGVAFKAMDETQRAAARELMRSALSSTGANKVEQIMALETVLIEIEKGARPGHRDPLAYSIVVFGEPAAGVDAQPWAWKIEGHHVALNFTGVNQQTAVTPAFLGSNPAQIPHGERAGTRVLAAEEDLGRELLASLDAEQRRVAIIADVAPADILAIPGRSIDEVDASGLAVASMNDNQRAIVERLLAVYAGNLRQDLAEHELQRIAAAGIGNLRFAWMGGDKRGEGHYYRLSGPTFVIEYDNTQNGANHVHTVWRDRQRDFGRDLLKEHLEHGHRH